MKLHLLCRLFGHKLERGYGGWDLPYLTVVRKDWRDGIGREHAVLSGHCGRCNTVFPIAKMHFHHGVE